MQRTKQTPAEKSDDERGENLLDHLSASEDTASEKTATEQTHFGFKQVAKEQKQSMVADVFHSVAAKYDVMNDLMSLGIHRIWKRYTIDCSGIRPGQKVLDLAGGTGDLAAKFSRMVGATGQVTLADINHSMLLVGKEKLTNMGIMSNLNYVQANAEALPFPDNHFDLVTMAFGLRNVTEKSNALASIFRVLKPGGRLLVLEFSKPTSDVFISSIAKNRAVSC
jgi:demethylmenaquinone methyltransferase/2-methoxy-6-polyprenyl-1,4-benzoquinol methylase